MWKIFSVPCGSALCKFHCSYLAKLRAHTDLYIYDRYCNLMPLLHWTLELAISWFPVSANEQHNLSVLMSAVTDTFFFPSPPPSQLSVFSPLLPWPARSPSGHNKKMDAGVAVPEMTPSVPRWTIDQSIHPSALRAESKMFPRGRSGTVDPTDRANW
jgi:hypothetical protein